MNERRREMESVLKAITIPLLRGMNFKGSFPHFYRVVGNHVDLLMFQFRLDGSSFIVEVSYADPKRSNVSFRPETPFQKLRVPSTAKRYRLGRRRDKGTEGTWFRLEHDSSTTSSRYFHGLALRVNDLLVREATPWWEAQRGA